MTNSVLFSFVPDSGTLHSQWRTLTRRGAQTSHSWRTLLLFFSYVPDNETLCSWWRTLTRIGVQTSYPWLTLFFSSLSYLIVELSIPDGELWPEEERKLFTNNRLYSRSSLPYLVVELSIPDGEIWPEQEHKLLIHDGLCSRSSLPYLIVELSIPDGELWPEEERILFFSYVPGIVKDSVPCSYPWRALFPFFSSVPDSGTLRFRRRTLTRRGAQIFHPWRTLFLYFSFAPDSGTLHSRWRTLTRRGAQTSHPWRILLFSSFSYLIVELSVPDGELWPEEERELLIHDRLCSLLLCSLDLLERHVAEWDGELTGGLAKRLPRVDIPLQCARQRGGGVQLL